MDYRDVSALMRLGRQGEARRTPACPDEVTLVGYATGREDHPPALEVHLADCLYCLGQLGALVRAQRHTEPERPVPEQLMESARKLAPRRRRPTSPSWRWALGAAAAATFAVVVGLTLGPGSGDYPREVGGGPAPAQRATPPAESKLEMLSPAEGARVVPGQAELRWTAIPGSLSYIVRVSDAGGDLVWQAELPTTSARLPAEPELQTGELYFVWVRASLLDGKSLRSPAVGFRVR